MPLEVLSLLNILHEHWSLSAVSCRLIYVLYVIRDIGRDEKEVSVMIRFIPYTDIHVSLYQSPKHEVMHLHFFFHLLTLASSNILSFLPPPRPPLPPLPPEPPLPPPPLPPPLPCCFVSLILFYCCQRSSVNSS